MKKKLLAGLSAAIVATLLIGGPAQAAACHASGTCLSTKVVKKQRQAKIHKVKTHKAKVHKAKSHKIAKRKSVRMASVRKLSGKRIRSESALAISAGAPRGRGHVVAMIKSQAPRMGVPAWFALRIAHVESGYNPNARGAAGELGVFQMKCQTARGLGFRGACSQLLNASTGVHWGLRHLQQAVRSSRGNLRLAASKHNGGLGRKTLVRKYVSRVF